MPDLSRQHFSKNDERGRAACIRSGHTSPTDYLRDLQRDSGSSAREIARHSRVLAELLGRRNHAFTHRAFLAWINGTRNPKLEHRRLLALIFGVSLDELNHALDGPIDEAKAAAALKRVSVRVFGQDRRFEYQMTIKGNLDLTRPAVYQHWADIFSPWPTRLVRHFGRRKGNLYGWIPAYFSSHGEHRSKVLAPLDARSRKIGQAGSFERHVWFVYLPGGVLDVGTASQEGRWLLFSKAGLRNASIERYPLSATDLVGRVSGRELFQIGSL